MSSTAGGPPLKEPVPLIRIKLLFLQPGRLYNPDLQALNTLLKGTGSFFEKK